jgi:hypothetical protein
MILHVCQVFIRMGSDAQITDYDHSLGLSTNGQGIDRGTW